jgi:hypothetical protein
MTAHLVTRTMTITLCLAILICSGCANFIVPEIGAVAREDARIPLPADGIEETLWEAKDLHLVYSITGTGDALQLTGHMVLDRSLTNSYGIVKSFFLRISFLNGAGQVLETADISPLTTAFGLVPEKMNIRASLVRPPGSAAIVFNYYGVFRGSFADGPGEEWGIYYFPFD